MAATVQPRDRPKLHKKVSVRGVFQRQGKIAAKSSKLRHAVLTKGEPHDEHDLKQAKQMVNICSSSSHKHSRISKKGSSSLSLEVTFKESSTKYRQHLHNVATTSINNTLSTNLQHLNDNKLLSVSSDNHDPNQSPLKITMSAKLEREANKIYQPLSNYQIRMTHTDATGKKVQIIGTLEQRMLDYEAYLDRQKKDIEKMANEWETIVGEIWKLGVSILGMDAMQQLSFTERTAQKPPSTAPAESTLFIPEDAEISQKQSDTKRVKFDAQVQSGSTEDMEHLAFLYQPTKIKNKPPPVVGARSKEVNDDLKKSITSLGKKHFTDMRAAQHEYDKYWQKKKVQIMLALKD